VEILRQIDLTELVKRALAEDVGQGDITTAATVEPSQPGRARITVKEPDGIVFCGGMLLERAFSLTASAPAF
jgi:nicotinate-nucleotide pyrophosphorylase (carboxylating)